MNTALITTTINVPTVLELYRQHGPDVAFFVAGDVKTPHADVEALGKQLNTGARWYQHEKMPIDSFSKFRIDTFHYYDVERQKSLGYKCSELIGWSNIQRRNIALLEAIKWGAEIIVSIDDDNIVMGDGGIGGPYFWWFARLLGSFPFNGIKVSSPTGWWDVGQLLDPVAPHRGFPISVDATKWSASHVTDAKVGLAAGICLGDPDVSAVTRLAVGPIAHRVSELLRSGIVVDPNTRTVFNSQNTAFIRELVPAFFMLPGVGRYDDIYASLIMQRVMRERNLHVHFGKPFVWQQRNQHNLVKDLRGELDGMESIERFARWLDGRHLLGGSVLDDVRQIWMQDPMRDVMPEPTIAAALAFLDDLEPLL